MDGINETAQPIFSGMSPMTPAVFGATQQRLQGEYAQPWEIAKQMQGFGPTGALQSVAQGMQNPFQAQAQAIGGVVDGNAAMPMKKPSLVDLTGGNAVATGVQGAAPISAGPGMFAAGPAPTGSVESPMKAAMENFKANQAANALFGGGSVATGVPGAQPIDAGSGMFGAAAKPAMSSLESQYTNGWNEATAPVKAPRTGGTDPVPAPQTGGTDPVPTKAPEVDPGYAARRADPSNLRE